VPGAGGWYTRPRLQQFRLPDRTVDREDRPSPAILHELRTAPRLRAALGVPVFIRTTVLPTHAGRAYPLAKHPDGTVLQWGLWAPQRRLLLDFFERGLPSQTELDARAQYAEAHALRYCVVPPGHTLSTDDLCALAQNAEEDVAS